MNAKNPKKKRLIEIFQGKGFTQSYGGLVDYFNKKSASQQTYLNQISECILDESFQNYVVEINKNEISRKIINLKNKIAKEGFNRVTKIMLSSEEKSLAILDWDWIKTNFYECFSSEFPHIVSDWRICLLDNLYNEYQRRHRGLYEFSKENKLNSFYKSKGVNLKMEDNYGLCPVLSNFQIKSNGLPKLYDKPNNTHILIKFVPNDFVRFLAELKSKNKFDLAFRPDYDICGENIKDLCFLMEGVEFGKKFDTQISSLPSISGLIDENHNRFVVQKDAVNLTFEEILDDFETYEDYIVTQVVHLEYCSSDTHEVVNHIDHEFVFYNIDEYSQKLSELRTKGTARKRFKTFKIDNAQIEFTKDVNTNIVFQTLRAFFNNDLLVNEYFQNLSARNN